MVGQLAPPRLAAATSRSEMARETLCVARWNCFVHTCSVVKHMSAGMKMMGKFKTRAAAESAMAGMKECHA
jgi:hypothetical protein